MSEHRARIAWTRDEKEFGYETYSRDHEWTFECGISVRASAAPDFFGNSDRVDPEEAFVASLASCHMLTFLALAARKRLVVEAYEDDAAGTLEKNEAGDLALTRVVLRPRVTFDASVDLSGDALQRMHERAHHACFLANSVKTSIDVEPR